MRFLVIFSIMVLGGCDNNNYTQSPTFSLFETSTGVLYLLNQNSGELELVSPKGAPVIRSGEIFSDGEGAFYRYLGEGKVQEVLETELLVDKYGN